MKKLKIAYFGTPYFSANFLEGLLTNTSLNQFIEVKFIATQPDKPIGRKQLITPSPVKAVAKNYQLLIHDNLKFKIHNSKFNSEFLNLNSELKKLDLVLLYAYGEIIPADWLTLPKYGFWYIQPSLLPKYRGSSPMAYPLMNGDKTTGVTIYKMDEKIDHGPIIAQEKYEILPTDKRPDLENKLTNLGFEMFKKIILTDLNQLQPTAQADQFATYTHLLTKQNGFISFENLKLKIKNSTEQLFNQFRGLYPWPGMWTIVRIGNQEKRLKITDLSLQPTTYNLVINTVQLEGKKEVNFKTFNQAYKIF